MKKLKELQTAAHYLAINSILKRVGLSITVFGIIYILLGLTFVDLMEVLLLFLGVGYVAMGIILRNQKQVKWILVLSILILLIGISNVVISSSNISTDFSKGYDYFFLYFGFLQIFFSLGYFLEYRKISSRIVDEFNQKTSEELTQIVQSMMKQSPKNNECIATCVISNSIKLNKTKIMVKDNVVFIRNTWDTYVMAVDDFNIVQLNKRSLENSYNFRIESGNLKLKGIAKKAELEKMQKWINKKPKDIALQENHLTTSGLPSRLSVEANRIPPKAPLSQGFVILMAFQIFYLALMIAFGNLFFVAAIPVLIGAVLAIIYIRKNLSENKFTRFIAWSNLYLWLLPPLGLITSVMSEIFHLKYGKKNKLYIVLGSIGYFITVFGSIALAGALTGKF